MASISISLLKFVHKPVKKCILPGRRSMFLPPSPQSVPMGALRPSQISYSSFSVVVACATSPPPMEDEEDNKEETTTTTTLSVLGEDCIRTISIVTNLVIPYFLSGWAGLPAIIQIGPYSIDREEFNPVLDFVGWFTVWRQTTDKKLAFKPTIGGITFDTDMLKPAETTPETTPLNLDQLHMEILKLTNRAESACTARNALNLVLLDLKMKEEMKKEMQG